MKKKISSKIILKSEKGMSLVDALIGVVLIGLIGTFLIGSFRTFMIGARTSSDRAQALCLAQQALEDFKRNDGAAIQNWPTSVDGKHTITPVIIPIAGLGGRLVSCQVTVNWITPQGNETLSLVSYYYR